MQIRSLQEILGDTVQQMNNPLSKEVISGREINLDFSHKCNSS